jgi:gliding motility-associated-like protein
MQRHSGSYVSNLRLHGLPLRRKFRKLITPIYIFSMAANMRSILILLLVGVTTTTQIAAQTPESIQLDGKLAPSATTGTSAEMMCNDAGTFQFGQFIGQSNDISPDTIFLCHRDSLFINHNGNASFIGDPNPVTPSGVVYGFYNCPPSIMGPDLTTLLGDCFWMNNTTGLPNVARGTADGDMWLTNSGSLLGAPNTNGVQYWFAPLTIDNFASLVYENTGGGPAGPCVNANTNDAFSIVYLREITFSGVSTNVAGNPCIGRAAITGGLPAFLPTNRYDVDISLASNPSVKALIMTQPTQLQSGNSVKFNVNTPGIYTMRVEDGKSCGATLTMNMSTCTTNNSPELTIPAEVGFAGNQICVPINVQDFISNNVGTVSFSISWDPTILQYVNYNTTIPSFFNGGVNAAGAANGFLGIGAFDPAGSASINIANGSPLINLCFNVIGTVGQISPVTFSANPTQVSITDFNGELSAVYTAGSVLVVDPGNINFSTEVISQGCGGNAQIRITATGGQEPYTIAWNPGGGTGAIANIGGSFTTPTLPAGPYTITMTDATGATFTGNVTIPSASIGGTLTVVQQPLCNGQPTGIIRADVSVNGVNIPNPGPEYTFTWAPATVPSPGNALQNFVAAGTYSVTITNTISGCTAVASGALTQPAAISRGSLQAQDAACTGVSNGSISYLAAGGVPIAPAGNYRFSWTYAPTVAGPFVPQTTNQVANPSVLTNLAAGVYRVTITDNNNCTFTDQVIINNAKTLTINGTITNAVCAGSSTGAVQVTVASAPLPPGVFGFVWQPVPVGSNTNSNPTSSTLSSIPAGNYIVVATENGTGCTIRDTFIVTQPDSVKVGNVVLTNPTCSSPMGGSIGLTVTGGALPYGYVWNTPNGNQGQANNLTAGTYRCTITDNVGCTFLYVTTLTIPNSPTVTFDSTSVRCGNDGCVQAIGNAVPGTSIQGFQWSNQATGTIIGITSEVCALNGGNYIVTVTASDGCFVIDTMTLFQPNVLALDTVTYILPRCFGDDDGIVGVTMQGGATPYTYQWSITAPSSPSLIGVEAGNYTVTVSDQSGCTVVVNTVLNNPPQIVVNYPTALIVPAGCFGECTGGATPVVGYNTTPPTTANFNFLWESGETDSIANELCAGINRVTITDPNNCFIIDSVIISQPAQLDLNVEITQPTCAGDSNGQALLAGTGGNGGPFIYDWGTTTANPAQNLSAGTYTVTLTDMDGCTDEFEVVVGEPNPVLVATDFGVTTDVICFGDVNGVAAVIVTGGNTGGYMYMWSGAVGNTAVVTDLPPGTYTVTVTDPLGCSGVSDPIIINNPPPVQGSYLPWEQLVCAGDQTTFEIDTILGGAGGPYQFTIDYGVELPQDFPVSITGGAHIITYLDRFGCSSEDSIFVIPGIDMQVIFGQPIVEVELGDTLFQLSPVITGGIIDMFTWTPAELVSDPTSLTPFATTFESTTYTLLVTDPNGCTGQGSVYVKIDPNRNVYIPNVITPFNRAGLNQRWKVFTGIGVERVNFARVYDRWGEMVHELTNYLPNNDDYSQGWDGTFRGRSLNPGVYVYLVEVRFVDGRVLLYRGDITIIK